MATSGLLASVIKTLAQVYEQESQLGRQAQPGAQAA